MELYLVRHAEATSSGVNPMQPLTENGVQQAQALGRRLWERGVKVERIVHSGVLRAQKTAELVGGILQVARIEMVENLRPNDSIDPIRREIADWQENTLLVGHLPFLGYLLWALNEEGTHVEFGNTTCVVLRRAGGNWEVETVLQPTPL